jgi:hypothetical protein
MDSALDEATKFRAFLLGTSARGQFDHLTQPMQNAINGKHRLTAPCGHIDESADAVVWRDRFTYMVDDIFDTLRPIGRVEIRTGVGRRRRWSEEQKDRIVAESYLAGAVVSEVAARGQSPAGLHALPGEEGRMCCAAADNSDRASCHNAGTRRETNGATINPALKTASQLTDLADQVPPNAPVRVPAPFPPRTARRPSR